MKLLTLTGVVLVGLAFSGGALASDDCTDPVADWQPREVLRQQLEQQGWEVQRIKVDDGCYEVRGTDKLGNRFKAEYSPASLQIRELKIKFDGKGGARDYLDRKPDQRAK
ncbi:MULTISPECIES: PepSY domain-containing protein [Lysobacteraceae]|uniref:PepSY domain-containing protein n=2 Tax=Novilysobacter TaxID=3382699 RepID=A0A7S6UDY3_9GAMM|nr:MULTISPECIES: PepSY domain-containing protein [Lysobacter]QOW18511.1 PepSY domain-containing protein [Lysobacter ciconiae]QOW20988.1 PepSY domain-containing protein [Lysobacter avium]QOW23483.1 PepSY domain-containing protein [Lysobacter sp. H23M47]